MAAPNLESLRHRRVTVLPDLYIDALATMPPWSETGAQMAAIAGRGGGNMPIGPVHLKLGGNAANLGVALARLGAKVELIAHTNPVGHQLLKVAAAGTRLSTRGLRVGEVASVTLGLECGGSNVMLSHAGPVVDFGPRRLTSEDWEAIESSDAVAVVNWAQNQRGTELLRAVARRLRGSGTFLFVDTGDPRHRMGDLAALLSDPMWEQVGALGLNENELTAFDPRAASEPIQCARELAGRLGTRLDLHTRNWAATVTASQSIRVAARGGAARRITGAGDAWNAGNLAGELLALPSKERLQLAHQVATLYVTGATGRPPTAADIALSRKPSRS